MRSDLIVVEQCESFQSIAHMVILGLLSPLVFLIEATYLTVNVITVLWKHPVKVVVFASGSFFL